MSKGLKRVELRADTDLIEIVEEVHSDGAPRLIERDGEALAVLISPEDFVDSGPLPKSKLLKKRLLSLAGSWSDLDAERMIDELYHARHESPPN